MGLIETKHESKSNNNSDNNSKKNSGKIAIMEKSDVRLRALGLHE